MAAGSTCATKGTMAVAALSSLSVTRLISLFSPPSTSRPYLQTPHYTCCHIVTFHLSLSLFMTAVRAGTPCLLSQLASDHTIHLQQQEVGRTVETACSRADL